MKKQKGISTDPLVFLIIILIVSVIALVCTTAFYGSEVKDIGRLLHINSSVSTKLSAMISECEKNIKHSEHCVIVITAVKE